MFMGGCRRKNRLAVGVTKRVFVPKNKAPRQCAFEGLWEARKEKYPGPAPARVVKPWGKVISTRPMLQRDSGKM